MSHARAHLSEAWRWSAEAEFERAEIVAAALGTTLPLLFAAVSGDLAPGLTAVLGALVVGRVEIAAGYKTHLRRGAEALAPTLLAAFLGGLCAAHGWLTVAALVMLAGAGAALGSFSRPMAVATARFTLTLLIASAAITSKGTLGIREAVGFVALVAIGALWTSALGLVLGAIVRRHRGGQVPSLTPLAATPRQRFARWRRTLTSPAGWNYPLRLAACVGVASAIDMSWPNHHFHWITLTVALLTQRQIEIVPVKTTQRALGTAIGVGLAAMTLRVGLSTWALGGWVALLSGARPFLRVRNYLAYSVVMAPLIIFIVDAGRPPNGALLVDRLVATLIGAALVVATNLLAVGLRLTRPAAVPKR